MTSHRPSLVLELPTDRWTYCLQCAKPWPCDEAKEETDK